MIVGNAGFLGANASTGISTGSGTAADPYIINGWDIASPSGGAGITIQSSNMFFQISGCRVDGTTGDYGIELFGVENGFVLMDELINSVKYGLLISGASTHITASGCNMSYNSEGCVIFDSTHINISTSEIYDNTNIGVDVYGNSDYVNVSGNTVAGSHYGIFLDGSGGASANIFYNNTCVNNTWFGVMLIGSLLNYVKYNNCSNNGIVGVIIYLDSYSNVINNNSCWNNGGSGITVQSCTIPLKNSVHDNNCSANQYGIAVIDFTTSTEVYNNSVYANGVYGMYAEATTTHNRFWNNTLSQNNGATGTYDPAHVQAIDDGANNWWNATGYGNFWADWTTPDVIAPFGIVDNPYLLDGAGGASDHYPRWVFSDTTPPTCSISSPATTPYYWKYASITISGVAHDNIAVASVDWANTATGGSGTATGTTNWFANIALYPGSNLIVITASDGAGNMAFSIITVISDSIAPSLNITSPSSMSSISISSQLVAVSGNAWDDIAVASVTWFNAATGVSGVASGTTNWSSSLISLSKGDNVITVRAWDAAGNYGVDIITITYTVPYNPNASLTGPTPSQKVAGGLSGAQASIGLSISGLLCLLAVYGIFYSFPRKKLVLALSLILFIIALLAVITTGKGVLFPGIVDNVISLSPALSFG